MKKGEIGFSPRLLLGISESPALTHNSAISASLGYRDQGTAEYYIQ
ncbi:hypothetical protein GQ543_08655 [candidate division WOR-3 bacterium]|nr:hypothetical protein [candidate division WOR-3 bacterium]